MTYFENNMTGLDRRSGIDRRGKNPQLFSKYLMTGKRSTPRRKADRQWPQKVDRYSAKTLTIILIILGLSIVDAIFTLVLVGNGAREVNPLLAYYLDHSPLFFLFVKYWLTCSSVILILFCKDFYIFNTRVKAKVFFYMLPIPFILVIPWQLHLILSCC